MTIRMYLILLFATVLAFASLAKAEQPASPETYERLNLELKRFEPLDLKKYQFPRQSGEILIVPKRQFNVDVVLRKLSEEEIQEYTLKLLLERAAKTKLIECGKVYEFDYFAYAASGNSLFQKVTDPALQAEQDRMYKEFRVYLINGKLTQLDPAASVDPEVAAYCENFASAQADVLAVQTADVSTMIQTVGGALEGIAKFFSAFGSK